jgi:hypothetical protein
MATLSPGYTFGATEEVTATNLGQLVSLGGISGIVAADISSGAITDVKINDVSGAKFTTLAAIPSGAGDIPKANLDGDWDTDVTLAGDSDLKLATQHATKTYADVGLVLKEDLTNKDIDGTLTANSDTKYPSQKAVKTYVDVKPGLSNVIFCFGLGGSLAVANAAGIILNDSITAANTEIMAGYWGVYGTTIRTLLTSKFVKTTNINTITVWCSIWQDNSTSTKRASCNIDIGGGAVSGSVLGTSQQKTPEWKSISLNVSGLVNGTTYDVLIQLKHNDSATATAYLDSIIGIVS